jgi:hypothetical protein
MNMNMDSIKFVQKKITATKAFKSKKCEWCEFVWGEGDDIFTVSDNMLNTFFLLCRTCGEVFKLSREEAVKKLQSSKSETIIPTDTTPPRIPPVTSVPNTNSTSFETEVLKLLKEILHVLKL